MSSTESTAATRGERKVRQGRVVSDKMDKTVTRSERLHAHDETNDVNVGDTVRIAETRPLSKTKRWRVVDIIERAQ